MFIAKHIVTPYNKISAIYMYRLLKYDFYFKEYVHVQQKKEEADKSFICSFHICLF
jgi:hypothetical protein